MQGYQGSLKGSFGFLRSLKANARRIFLKFESFDYEFVDAENALFSALPRLFSSIVTLILGHRMLVGNHSFTMTDPGLAFA